MYHVSKASAAFRKYICSVKWFLFFQCIINISGTTPGAGLLKLVLLAFGQHGARRGKKPRASENISFKHCNLVCLKIFLVSKVSVTLVGFFFYRT